MKTETTNKELVAAGHQLAKALGSASPLLDMAKLVSDLATRLDCAIVRGDVLQTERDALAAENVALKTNLMFWDAENPESPYDDPSVIASNCEIPTGQEFVVQVAAKMPDRKYRVSRVDDYDCEVELVEGGLVKTPATDAWQREQKALGAVEAAAHIRGFAQTMPEEDRAPLHDAVELCLGKANQLRAEGVEMFAKYIISSNPTVENHYCHLQASVFASDLCAGKDGE